MPENCLYVGRPTKYGNPFNWQSGVQEGYTERTAKTMVVDFYKSWILGTDKWNPVIYGQPPTLDEIKQELKGKDLCCWCKESEPCHTSVLLEIANS